LDFSPSDRLVSHGPFTRLIKNSRVGGDNLINFSNTWIHKEKRLKQSQIRQRSSFSHDEENASSRGGRSMYNRRIKT
jgi:hypothetical protein